LREGRSRTIGLAVPDITTGLFTEIVRRIEKRAACTDYQIILVDTEEDVVSERERIAALMRRKIDGLEAIRTACRSTPVGVSTGAWIVPDADQRLALIGAWEVLPDFAGVNFHEPGALEVARLLLGKGIAVEAGARDVKRTVRIPAAVRLHFSTPFTNNNRNSQQNTPEEYH